MKHRIFGKKLGRTHNQRQALLKGLVRNIFTYGSIKTTEAKAKSVIPLIESLSHTIVTEPDLKAKRELFRYLQSQHWVNRVVKVMKDTFGGQDCNFTSVTRVKRRQGDDALIVKLSFTKSVNFAPSTKVDETKTKVEKEVKKPVKKTTKK